MRARNLKPGFFKSEQLLKCEPLARILFEGLWCLADRDGRLEDRPFQIKIEVLPCDNCDVNLLLQQLHDNSLILRYEIGGVKLIQVLTFSEHQTPHMKEKPSTLPPNINKESCAITIQAPDKHQTSTNLGNCQHPLNPESLFLNPESTQPREESFFQKCFDLATSYFPALQTSNTSEIHAWKEAGYDFEKHIKPVLESMKAKGKQPRSFKFFTPEVEDSAHTKIKPAPPAQKMKSVMQL